MSHSAPAHCPSLLRFFHAEISFDNEDINPDLVRLMSSRFFRVVLSTTFDPSVETLMDMIWGNGNYRIMNIYNDKGDNYDFSREELMGDEFFDIQPTLYYVFGKADDCKASHKFVLNDNDTLECISRWLGKEVPERLMSYIAGKKLLVLGCNLKDWCFRFFWYAMRHNSGLNRGDIAVLLKTDSSEQDENLYRYLHDIIHVRIQSDSRNYITRLADALDEKIIAQGALTNSRMGGIFISYASEDFATAWNIFTRLREKGFNVWLDNRKLSVSDKYDTRIQNAISQCKVFMPILSSTVASDLTENRKRYYPDEWELAASVNSDKLYFPIAISGYDHHRPYHQLLPEKIRKVTVFDWMREPFDTLIAKLENISWQER